MILFEQSVECAKYILVNNLFCFRRGPFERIMVVDRTDVKRRRKNVSDHLGGSPKR